MAISEKEEQEALLKLTEILLVYKPSEETYSLCDTPDSDKDLFIYDNLLNV